MKGCDRLRAVDLIRKKKEGLELNDEEIRFLVRGYTEHDIPDYQMSAFLMAVCFQGMTDEEILSLTLSMRDSGKVMDLGKIKGQKIDKHSTGGIGDKTTLVLSPIVASLGIPVTKMSGRGLGYTGGTVDKLQSIPGYRCEYTTDEFIDQVKKHGIIVAGQSDELAPADRMIYALRDATGTVDSIPLIASSIMSKKLSSGCDGIVLDVTCGSGAFMKDEKSARKLANLMVTIGKKAGKRMSALITSMDEPLGFAVGNSNEVKEAVGALKGNGPSDLMTVVYGLGSEMLMLAGIYSDRQSCINAMKKSVADGSAYNKMVEWISSQGGDASFLDDTSKFPAATKLTPVRALCKGYVSSIDSDMIGKSVMLLGGGRKKMSDKIDSAVGIKLIKKTGDYVRPGDIIMEISSDFGPDDDEAIHTAANAYHYSDEMPLKSDVIIGVIK